MRTTTAALQVSTRPSTSSRSRNGIPRPVPRRNPGEQEREAELRGEEPERSSRGGEQRALGQELTDQAPSARAERHPDGELLLPTGRAREQEVGHIHAGHQEHQVHADEEEDQHRLDAPDQLVPERDHVAHHASDRVGEALAERVLERGQLLPRLRDRGAVARSRAMGRIQFRFRRVARSPCGWTATSRRASPPGAKGKPGGSTPTTVVGSPARLSVVPSTWGSAPPAASSRRRR